jgi:ABC-type lipoprotein export system ATPase subunit
MPNKELTAKEMMTRDAAGEDLLRQPAERLLGERPYVRDFFAAFGLPAMERRQTAADVFDGLDAERLEDLGLTREQLSERFCAFIEKMENFRREGMASVREVSIIGGRDKDGRPEDVRLDLRTGEVIAVVGPTGAGKSLLLSDIECLAQGDTPSGRRILIDGEPPDEAARLSGEQRLVAQLSQNMNFVMDLSVREFVALHAESRLVEDVDAVVDRIFTAAVRLSGEPFRLETPVTALSGGQSRALMIADVACLSVSPIVLIDEIENAGVDRRQALDLLVKREKIVLIATHDPLLALSSDRRMVVKNGGIVAVLDSCSEERAILGQLQALDDGLSLLRSQIRGGLRLDCDLMGLLAAKNREAGF